MSGMSAPTISNSEVDRLAVLNDAEAFGKREGSGSAARASFYATLTEWAKHRRIDVTDAPIMWDKFALGASQGASMIGGVKETTNPEDTRKVRVSECRQFIKMGALPLIDGIEVLDRGMRIIKSARIDGRLKSKPTDAMIAIAREQCKDEQNPLDDDTIERVIQPKEGGEKVEADALESVRKRLEGIVKKFEDSAEINDAIAYVTKRIQDLGGTSAYQNAQKALAKKAAKAAAKAGK